MNLERRSDGGEAGDGFGLLGGYGRAHKLVNERGRERESRGRRASGFLGEDRRWRDKSGYQLGERSKEEDASGEEFGSLQAKKKVRYC